jgi:hypothetical protein
MPCKLNPINSPPFLAFSVFFRFSTAPSFVLIKEPSRLCEATQAGVIADVTGRRLGNEPMMRVRLAPTGGCRLSSSWLGMGCRIGAWADMGRQRSSPANGGVGVLQPPRFAHFLAESVKSVTRIRRMRRFLFI